jgi:hypothetical protein
MTTFLVVKNNAVSTLAGDINNSTTTVVVAAGEGARFPSTYPYHISIDSEILSVTNRSTDTFTVATRGTIESTSAASHSAGAVVALNVTAQAVSDLNTAVNSLEGGIAGNLDDTAGGTDSLVTKAPTSNAFRDHAVATTDVHGAGAGTLATTATAQQYVEDTGLVMADAKNIEFDPSPGTSHTANGIIVTLTAGAALVFGDACYMGTDGKMEKALADDAAITIPATHLCLATISENSAGLFLEKGWAHDDHFAFDVGKSIYLSAATAGLITKTMPTKVTGNQVQVLGLCGEIADVIYWNPDSTIVEYA